ncbi:MAG: DUF4430 domain-containing protein [Butyrivibrio sp.]|nr:DUF4430 domain-containing protein [Butyrivibrio sp.]
MRNKTAVWAAAAFFWLSAALGAVFSAASVSARETADAASREAERTAERIWKYEMEQAGVSDYEEYLRVCLVPYAGEGAEWLFICLKQWEPELDCGEYDRALDEYLEKNSALAPTDYQRIALAKSAMGTDRERIAEIIGEYTGQGGIMSSIYGLLLADSGDYVPRAERLALASELVKMQLPDGGFALSGQYSDTDVTAMALQALAPYKNEYGGEIERALSRLSELQRDNGGFASLGTENSESAAQVLMALCALDIDYARDERFIKNSRTVWDAISEYECADGGFSHIKGRTADKMATSQALAAAVCLNKYLTDGGFIYDFGNSGSDRPPQTAEAETNGSGAAKPTEKETESETEIESNDESSGVFGSGIFSGKITGAAIKALIICVTALIALIALAVSFIRRRLDKFRALWIVVPAAAVIAAAAFSRIETRDEHYAQLYDEGEITTYIAVVGCDGELLSRQEIMTESGETAFDQLKRALARERINLDYGGSGMLGNVYVRGIGGLSEFDYGSLSGWTYRVNGEYPNKSCASLTLYEGDYVEWIYTKDGKKEGGTQ